MKKLLTHAGIFHADDVFSTALIENLNENETFEIVRDNYPTNFEGFDYVYDIGGQYDGEKFFDHHQELFLHECGMPMAAFGLLWKTFGEKLTGSKEAAEIVEKDLVILIDKADNGKGMNLLSTLIGAMNPRWDDPDGDTDEAFIKAVAAAKPILAAAIDKGIGDAKASGIVKSAVEEAVKNGSSILVFDKYVPTGSLSKTTPIKFVIYPSSRGGWNAMVINKACPFPEGWAGKPKDELMGLMPGLTFCHQNRLILATETKDQAIRCCDIAMGK